MKNKSIWQYSTPIHDNNSQWNRRELPQSDKAIDEKSTANIILDKTFLKSHFMKTFGEV